LDGCGLTGAFCGIDRPYGRRLLGSLAQSGGCFLMATNTDVNHRIDNTVEPQNWPALISKTVDDLSSIAKTEMELFEVRLQRLIEAQTEKIAGILFLLIAAAYGLLFLLGGIVLVIHLWLAWWLAFLITGAAVVAAGVAVQLSLTAAAKAKTS
jgi:hypothetical protein